MGEIIREEGLISLGPWGGKEGVYWAYKPNGPIMQISIRYGEAIDSILFESKSSDGVVLGCSQKIGGSGGHTTKTFSINSSVEQLSAISLTYEMFYGEVTIISLSFHTNVTKYGPFGSRSGASSVSIPIEGGVIVGFHGRVGTYITAIGMFVAPKVDYKKIVEELKAEIEDLKTKIKELEEREHGLLTYLKDLEAQNEVLRERIKELEKEVLFDLHVTIKKSVGAVEASPVTITFPTN